MEALLPRRSSSRGVGLSGYTLVEVVVAMLIAAVMVTAVFGVALTSKTGGGGSMRRILADQGIAQVSTMLRSYVTACGCNPSSGVCNAAKCTTISGPNNMNSGVDTWNMNTDLPHAGVIPVIDAGSPGGAGRPIYALTCGNHYITGISPALEAAPYNGYFLYNVSWPGGCPANSSAGTPSIAFTANWTNP